MYGVSGWSVGIADMYAGDWSVRWCIRRCFGVGIGAVFMVCCVEEGDWAWKSPRMMNDVFGNLVCISVLVLVKAGVHENLSLCCTSYMFIIVRCAFLVCSVVQ